MPVADALASPNLGQIALLYGAIALFIASGAISLLRLRRESETLRIAAKACAWSGVTVAAAVLAWHSIGRGSWLPLEDNFDALIWLGLLLALFVLYVQRRRHIGGLDLLLISTVFL